MPDESVPKAPKEWIVQRKRIAGLVDKFLGDHGVLAEFKERVRWVKKDYMARVGHAPDKETSRNLYWDTAWMYVDACVASEPVEPVAEPEPEPEPESETVPILEQLKQERLLIDPSIFDGKDCPDRESIKWAVENIGCDVTEADAPSQMAWAVVAECRDNPALRFALFTNLLPRIVAKPKEEGGDGFTDDGGTLDLLDQIERASREAEESADDD